MSGAVDPRPCLDAHSFHVMLVGPREYWCDMCRKAVLPLPQWTGHWHEADWFGSDGWRDYHVCRLCNLTILDDWRFTNNHFPPLPYGIAECVVCRSRVDEHLLQCRLWCRRCFAEAIPAKPVAHKGNPNFCVSFFSPPWPPL